MVERKSPAGDETIASASTHTPFWKRRTPEEWRQRILENPEKLRHVELARVDWFVRSILHGDPHEQVLKEIRTSEADHAYRTP